MTLVASPTPSLISIGSSSSASSSVGDRSPRQFSLNSFSDASPLTPNEYRNPHTIRSQSHSQPSSPSTSVISSLASNRILPISHSLEDANRLGGKHGFQPSSRSVTSTFVPNPPKKEKKKLTTRRLIDREKHSANECRRRTEMREKFLQLQEITHCVYKDRQNILITAIRRISEQNARIARLEKEKQGSFQDSGRIPPKQIVSNGMVDSVAIPASATVVTALPCKAEGSNAELQKNKVAIPVNTLASIGATDLLPSFLLAHPDTIVDVNFAFLSLFQINGRESIQSCTLSSLCASSQDVIRLHASMEHILANEPRHTALSLHLVMNSQTYNVQLILRAILSPNAPPQILGMVSEQESLPKEMKPIVNLTAESSVLPAVIIKEEPGLHPISDTTEKSNVNILTNTLVHSSSMSNLLDAKAPSCWSMNGHSLSNDVLHTDMDISESLYASEDHDSIFARFNASPLPINLSNHLHSQDQFMTSVFTNTLSNEPIRSSIQSAFADTTIWNDIM